MEATSVSMVGGSWDVCDTNLYINSCNFTNFKITSQKSSEIPVKTNLTLLNTFHTDSNFSALGSRMKLSGTNVYFINTTMIGMFSNNTDGIIHASSKSNIYFIDTKILQNGVISSVINVTEDSSLSFEHCTIENNNSTKFSIIALYSSKGNFTNCQMKGNSGHFGGVIFASHLNKESPSNNTVTAADVDWESTSVPSILVSDCFFANNNGFYGGSIYLSKGVKIQIGKCTFLHNSAYNGGCIDTQQNTVVDIYESTFTENSVRNEAGVLHAETQNSIFIHDSAFKRNKAMSMGVITVVNASSKLIVDNCLFEENESGMVYSVIMIRNATLNIHNASFLNNTSVMIGCISLDDGTGEIKNVTFKDNSAVQGSCIHMGSKSTLQVSQANFSSNSGGSVISCVSQNKLIIEESTFVNHTLPADTVIEISNSESTFKDCVFMLNSVKTGVLQVSETRFVKVAKCRFIKNDGRYGAASFVARGSKLYVENSTFQSNTAMSGGFLNIIGSSVEVQHCSFSNNTAKAYGGAIAGIQSSSIFINESVFTNHHSYMGGVLYINDSTLTTQNSIFESSTAHLGGVIYKFSLGNVAIDNCSFRMNTADYGGTIYFLESQNLRLSNTICKYRPEIGGFSKDCIDFDLYQHKYNCDFLTLNFTFDDGKNQVSSTETTFLQEALARHMIFSPGAILDWKESTFASG